MEEARDRGPPPNPYPSRRDAPGWAHAPRALCAQVTVLAKLDHPHIVHVQAVFQQVDPRTRLNVAYVQLPYYAQGDAARWLDEAEPPPPLEARQKVLQQLAQALHHLHANGYAHGDVKLEARRCPWPARAPPRSQHP